MTLNTCPTCGATMGAVPVCGACQTAPRDEFAGRNPRDVEQIKRDILTSEEIPEDCGCDYGTDTGPSYCLNCVARAWEEEATILKREKDSAVAFCAAEIHERNRLRAQMAELAGALRDKDSATAEAMALVMSHEAHIEKLTAALRGLESVAGNHSAALRAVGRGSERLENACEAARAALARVTA